MDTNTTAGLRASQKRHYGWLSYGLLWHNWCESLWSRGHSVKYQEGWYSAACSFRQSLSHRIRKEVFLHEKGSIGSHLGVWLIAQPWKWSLPRRQNRQPALSIGHTDSNGISTQWDTTRVVNDPLRNSTCHQTDQQLIRAVISTLKAGQWHPYNGRGLIKTQRNVLSKWMIIAVIYST